MLCRCFQRRTILHKIYAADRRCILPSSSRSFQPPDEDEDYLDLVKDLYGPMQGGRQTKSVLLIQPRIKATGLRFSKEKAAAMVAETKALIETLPGWRVSESRIESLPGENTNRFIFGNGKVMELTKIIQDMGYDCVVINVPRLLMKQYDSLTELWRVPILDRYALIIQIFKQRANTVESKLQVSLAEIPYLKSRFGKINLDITYRPSAFDRSLATLKAEKDRCKLILSNRNRKLHDQLKQIRANQDKQRFQRIKIPGTNRVMPLVAVVGYTNSGKSSLIRILSHDASVEGSDRLFATLDVSHHAGRLPKCGHPVIYADTVGFLSDLPAALLPTFTSTLNEIRHADLLVHVRDMHHPECEEQNERVLETLHRLHLPKRLLKTCIHCCNKIDLVPNFLCPAGSLAISCADNSGISELKSAIEDGVMSATGLMVRTFKVPLAGEHMNFLYAETHVITVNALEKEEDFILITVVLNSDSLHKYESRFGTIRKTRLRQ